MVAGLSRTFDAAGQREVALAQAQRLARLVDRHQRRTARRVDGDRGTLQPQPIADPARRRGMRRSDGHDRPRSRRSSARRMPCPGSRGWTDPRTPRCWCRPEPLAPSPNAPPRATPSPAAADAAGPSTWPRASTSRRTARRIPSRRRRNRHDGSRSCRAHRDPRRRIRRHPSGPSGTSDTASRPSRSTSQNSSASCGAREARCIADDGKTRGRLDRMFGGSHAVVLPCVGGRKMPRWDTVVAPEVQLSDGHYGICACWHAGVSFRVLDNAGRPRSERRVC